MELRVDPEFKAIIPPLSKDERAALEASILEEGVRDAIVVWGDTIVDGHNRYEIATGMNAGGVVLPFQTSSKDFESRDAAKLWILKNQLGRRNLTDKKRYDIAKQLWAVEKELAKKRQLAALKQNAGPEGTVPLNSAEREKPDEAGESAEKAAKEAGLSRDKLRKMQFIEYAGRSDLLEAIDDPEVDLSIHRAHQIAKITSELPGELGEEVASLDPDMFSLVHDPNQLKRLKNAEDGMAVLEAIVSDDKPGIKTVFAAEQYLKNSIRKDERNGENEQEVVNVEDSEDPAGIKQILRAGAMEYVVEFNDGKRHTIVRSAILEKGYKKCECCKGYGVVERHQNQS